MIASPRVQRARGSGGKTVSALSGSQMFVVVVALLLPAVLLSIPAFFARRGERQQRPR